MIEYTQLYVELVELNNLNRYKARRDADRRRLLRQFGGKLLDFSEDGDYIRTDRPETF